MITVTGQKDTRSGFGDGIVEVASKNPDIVALTADLAGSLKLNQFIKEFPERFIQCGIAEANMIGIAAGMTIGGKIPYTTTFANFSTGTGLRSDPPVSCLLRKKCKNLRITCRSYAGRRWRNTSNSGRYWHDENAARHDGDCSLRLCTNKSCYYGHRRISRVLFISDLEDRSGQFLLLKWNSKSAKPSSFTEGKDVSIFACGHLVWIALEAEKILREKGISAEVINIHTIKPLDTEAILKSIQKTGCAVTAEEHNIIGGLGDSIAHTASKTIPVPIEYVGTNDTFGESGTPSQLLEKYGLDSAHIVSRCRESDRTEK